jgi:hypothetical protein
VNERTCSVNDCERRRLARSLCSTHYMRVYREEVRTGQRVPTEPVDGGGSCQRCGQGFEYQRKAGAPRSVCRPCRAADWAWRLYGLTSVTLPAFYEGHGGKCGICGGTESPTQWGHRLMIDHDHATGALRGLLCTTCNTGVGYFADDPVRLEAAAAYLRSFDG